MYAAKYAKYRGADKISDSRVRFESTVNWFTVTPDTPTRFTVRPDLSKGQKTITRVPTVKETFRIEQPLTKPSWIEQIQERLKEGLSHIPPTPRYEALKREHEQIAQQIRRRRLAPLPPDTSSRISEALTSPPVAILIERGGIAIGQKDLYTLSGSNWLNDEVINFYLSVLLVERSKGTLHAFSTFFYSRLSEGGYPAVQRWTRRVDLFGGTIRMILFPINLSGNHWVLAAADLDACQVVYYDSLGGRNQVCLDRLLAYLRLEHLDKQGGRPLEGSWTAIHASNTPRQRNGYDCGVFTLAVAERITARLLSGNAEPFDFGQAEMPYFRQRICMEILQGRLFIDD